MKIGIVGALEEEISIIKEIIYNQKIKKNGTFKIYQGEIKNKKIFLIKSGIGKVCASIATTMLIHLYKINIIINIGSAGALKNYLQIGDIIIPKKICYYDVNLTNFGYSKGQVPKHPKKFNIDKNLYNIFKKILLKFNLRYSKGLIVTGDSFIRGEISKKIKYQFSSAIGVDMESAAIAQVCYHFKIPYIIIKSISDLSDNNATLNFKKNISTASFQSSKLAKLILENINF